MAERVDYFFSFRSPYSYLSAPRAFALPEVWDIDLVYRGTIPMVMRGQTVSREKGINTVRDTKREANALGMPFGPVHDPVGPGAMRSLLVGELAADEGLEKEFVLSASRGIWAEAIDVATDAGLKLVVERAGLDWTAALAAIDNADYAARLEANVAELEAMNHWGVPTFVIRGEIFWGQDRIVDLETRMAEYGLKRP
jgi:2-hydroxychromene-2-carboxylate isomerase